MHKETHHQLTQLANKLKNIHFNDEQSTQRSKSYNLKAGSIWLNYTRNPITRQVYYALMQLAKNSNLNNSINALFAGEKINRSENRAAKHWLLRAPLNKSDRDSIAVHRVLDKMAKLVDKIENNTLLKEPVTDIICIGIGGSELGSRLVYEALTMGKKTNIRLHFIANIDGIAVADAMVNCRPDTTLFLITSKTFTTFETAKNFATLKKWLLTYCRFSEDNFWQRCFVITANIKNALLAGVPKSQIFEFWDWVGGRYSLWSAVGLPIAITCGMQKFKELLSGAHAMDKHFHTTTFEKNLPVTLGLLHIWYSNYLQYPTRAVIPYAQNLKLLPDYLQQLEMESLGKAVDNNGNIVDFTTCPIIWGAAGTNVQHSFFQLLHQGTQIVPIDFIAAINPCDDLPPAMKNYWQQHHTALLANCLSQNKSLMQGGDIRHNGHGRFNGNRPSNVILLDKITPYSLGELIAAYEHKVFVQSIIWEINAFDQFGVELGKKMFDKIISQNKEKIDISDIEKIFNS